MIGVNDIGSKEGYYLGMKKIQFKRILVTHDGSDCASAILPYVTSLENTLNAEIILLRVIGPFITDYGLSGMIDIGPLASSMSYGIHADELAREVKKVSLKEMDIIKNNLIKSGAKKVKTIVLEGYAPEVIQYIIKKEKIDLIMMSTHGRTGLRKALLGSIAEQTIHSSSCPVFTVRPKEIPKKKKV